MLLYIPAGLSSDCSVNEQGHVGDSRFDCNGLYIVSKSVDVRSNAGLTKECFGKTADYIFYFTFFFVMTSARFLFIHSNKKDNLDLFFYKCFDLENFLIHIRFLNIYCISLFMYKLYIMYMM